MLSSLPQPSTDGGATTGISANEDTLQFMDGPVVCLTMFASPVAAVNVHIGESITAAAAVTSHAAVKNDDEYTRAPAFAFAPLDSNAAPANALALSASVSTAETKTLTTPSCVPWFTAPGAAVVALNITVPRLQD